MIAPRLRAFVKKLTQQVHARYWMYRSLAIDVDRPDDRRRSATAQPPRHSQVKAQSPHLPHDRPSHRPQEPQRARHPHPLRMDPVRSLDMACSSGDAPAILHALRLVADEIRQHSRVVDVHRVRRAVRALKKHGHRDDLMDVARMRHLPMDVDCLRTVLKSLGVGENADENVELLGLWKDRGLGPDVRAMFSAYHALREADRGIEANAVLSELRQHMRRGTLCHDDVAYVLAWLSEYGCWQDALTVLHAHENVIRDHKDDGRFDPVQCLNLALRACAVEGQADTAEVLLTRWEEHLRLYDAMSYSTLAEAYVKAGRLAEAEGVIERVKSCGLSPPPVMHNTVFNAYCKQRHVAEALRVLDMMVDDGVRPTSSTMTVLVKALIEARRWQQAVTCLHVAEAMDIMPAAPVYYALLRALVKAGKARDALKVLDSFKPQAVPISNKAYVYSTVIDVHSKSGQWERAVQMLSMMIRDGCEPTVQIWSDVIHSCSRGSQKEAVIEVYERMVEAGLEANAPTAQAVLLAYGMLKRYDEALDMLENSARLSQPSSVASAASGKKAPATTVLLQIQRRAFGVVLLMAAADGRADIVRRLRHMLQRREYLVVDDLTAACAMALARIDDTEDALRVLPSPTGADNHKLEPDVYELAVVAVMRSLGRKGNWSSALYLLEELHLSRASVDVLSSVSAALRALSHDAHASGLFADSVIRGIYRGNISSPARQSETEMLEYMEMRWRK